MKKVAVMGLGYISKRVAKGVALRYYANIYLLVSSSL